jgi:hypothetical protein
MCDRIPEPGMKGTNLRLKSVEISPGENLSEISPGPDRRDTVKRKREKQMGR